MSGTLGRTLNAETSGANLDLGRKWVGEVRDRIADAIMSDRTDGDDDNVDLSAVLAGVEDLGEALTTNVALVGDALRNLRRASDAVGAKKSGTRDAAGLLTRWRESARGQIENMMIGAKMIWAPPVKTVDTAANTTAVRNAIYDASKATTMTEKVNSLNDANRAFWAPRK